MSRAATTPQEGRAATKLEKADKARLKRGWAETVTTRDARCAIRAYLTRCYVYGPCPAGDLQAQGIRDAALTLMNTLRVNCPEALLLMETEATEDRDAIEAAEEADDA